MHDIVKHIVETQEIFVGWIDPWMHGYQSWMRSQTSSNQNVGLCDE